MQQIYNINMQFTTCSGLEVFCQKMFSLESMKIGREIKSEHLQYEKYLESNFGHFQCYRCVFTQNMAESRVWQLLVRCVWKQKF